MRSQRPNNYEQLLPAFQKAHADFGSSGFHLTAWPSKGEHRRQPPEEVEGYECFGTCDLPNIKGFPSETYGLHAVGGKEFAEALGTFRRLASLAGASLPAVIRDVLPHCASGGVIGLWIRFLWYFGLPDRSDRAKLEWHFERVGSGILSVRDYWLIPFRASSLAIERCRPDTDSSAFFRLNEIPGLAQRTAPAIVGLSGEARHSGGTDSVGGEQERGTSVPKHSADFASCNWFGAQYEFTHSQAACIKVLWEAWENGTPVMSGAAILEAADVSSELRIVFRSHPAWGTMIVSSTKGRYMLKEPTA